MPFYENITVLHWHISLHWQSAFKNDVYIDFNVYNFVRFASIECAFTSIQLILFDECILTALYTIHKQLPLKLWHLIIVLVKSWSFQCMNYHCGLSLLPRSIISETVFFLRWKPEKQISDNFEELDDHITQYCFENEIYSIDTFFGWRRRHNNPIKCNANHQTIPRCALCFNNIDWWTLNGN